MHRPFTFSHLFPLHRAMRPSASRLERVGLEALGRALRGVPVRIRYRDVTVVPDDSGTAMATVTIADRSTLWRLLRRPDLAFGEAFMAGRLEVDGDLVGLLDRVFRIKAGARTRWRWRAPVNTRRASRDNVHHHYDIGNEFYRLWLDDDLVYTCAYFPTPDTTLEAAQTAKMDLVCRKVGLRPGERVVEAGCGWGGLARYMARQYGARVMAYNISREQIRYARDRARAEGLGDRVTFVEDDYRAIRGEADVFVSVGMAEHVGPAHYRELGDVIRRVLGPGQGRGLLHFIGRARPRPLQPWIAKRIFPGAYPPTLVEAIGGILEPLDFSVLDVENLRLHYAKTLDHWRRRFLAASGEVRRMFGAPFERAWRLYLSGSQAAFQAGSLHLFQIVFAPSAANAIPWTRGALGQGGGFAGTRGHDGVV